MHDKSLQKIFPKALQDQLRSGGKEFINSVGKDIVNEVIFNVLCGQNLRDITEILTKKRVSKIGTAILTSLITANSKNPDFISNLPNLACKELKTKKNTKEERWFLQWILGLTDKGFQNILRDKISNLDEYVKNYNIELNEITSQTEKQFGKLSGNIQIKNDSSNVDWKLIIQILGIIGSQTLAIRGSDKSTYGKLFEKLILGSILSILGFKHIEKENVPKNLENLFWLSERKDKRESDATVLCEPGKAVRFDIGFIGRGNPEIALDKVSRFERELEFGRQKYYATTIVLIDRIGEKSRIETMAKEINGTIIQMSMSYWPKQLAKTLKEKTGHKSNILKINDEQLSDYLYEQVQKINFNNFL
jgi:hypothetical protein